MKLNRQLSQVSQQTFRLTLNPYFLVEGFVVEVLADHRHSHKINVHEDYAHICCPSGYGWVTVMVFPSKIT